MTEQVKKDDRWFEPLIRNYLNVDESWYEVPGIRASTLELSIWVDENIHGRYKSYGYYWYFEDINDYTAFVLRWGN